MFTDSRRKRRQKNRLITLGICLTVLGVAMYGYNFSRAQVRQQAGAQTPTPKATMMIPAVTPNIPAMVQTDPVIAEHAVVLLKTKYLGCAHVKEQELTVDGIVGMNQTQFSVIFPQCAITMFTPTRVEMTRELEGVCQKHYILKQENYSLVIYQRESDDSWRKVQTIEDFVMSYKDEKLEGGVVFDDMHQIESFLENIDE